MPISQSDIILRLIIAAALGTVVGYERERQNQPAGLRTHMILVVGATLAMTLSINLAIQFRDFVPNGDPARLAAQVISGIGFLGAGAILRYGSSVKGLTTATSLWTMAIVGMAVGAGYYLVGVASVALLMVILALINKVEIRAIDIYAEMQIEVTAEDRPGIVDEVKQLLDRHSRRINAFAITKETEAGTVHLRYEVKMAEDEQIDQLADELAQIPGTKCVRIHE